MLLKIKAMKNTNILVSILDCSTVQGYHVERGEKLPQISLYIDEETLEKIKAAAEREHTSISKWVAGRIRLQVEPEYPAGYEALFGAIKDASFAEPHEINALLDAFRESM